MSVWPWKSNFDGQAACEMAVHPNKLDFSDQITIRQDDAGPTVIFRRRDIPSWWLFGAGAIIVGSVLVLIVLNTVLWGWVPLWIRAVMWIVLTLLLYPTAGVLANRVELMIRDREFIMRRRPLPLRRDRHVPLAALDGFAVQPMDESTSGGAAPRYALYASLADGSRQYLLALGDSPEAGLELVTVLQALLGRRL